MATNKKIAKNMKLNLHATLTFCIILLWSLNTLPQQLVIFDLGGVLLKEAEANLHKAKNADLEKVLAGNLPKIRIFNRAFEFAELFCGHDCKTKWIIGTISGREIVAKIKENIDKQEYKSFFKDQYEKDLIKYGIEFVLVPELLVTLTEVINEGLQFVKKCKAHNIQVSIISNWDPESFVLLKDQLPELMSLFDNNTVIIPAMLGKTKPSPEIYALALARANVPIENCFFIDDSAANVMGAQKCGIKSVVHKNWQNTHNELIRLGLNVQ